MNTETLRSQLEAEGLGVVACKIGLSPQGSAVEFLADTHDSHVRLKGISSRDFCRNPVLVGYVRQVVMDYRATAFAIGKVVRFELINERLIVGVGYWSNAIQQAREAMDLAERTGILVAVRPLELAASMDGGRPSNLIHRSELVGIYQELPAVWEADSVANWKEVLEARWVR